VRTWWAGTLGEKDAATRKNFKESSVEERPVFKE
jgi:hypothetical protein